ncbi:MAG: hypothetical protein AAGD25_27815 [Cyanobacteria bacterium P01_F01_bin.150]
MPGFNWPASNLAVSGNAGIGVPEENLTEKLHVDGTIILQAGVAINEFSDDPGLTDNSDQAIPTEQAVKAYVDGQVSDLNTQLSQKAEQGNLTALEGQVSTLNTQVSLKADQTDFTALAAQVGALNTQMPLKAEQSDFADLEGQVNTLNAQLPLKANQTDLTTGLATKANLNGSGTEPFETSNLTVRGTLTVDGDMIARDVEHFVGGSTLGDSDTDEIRIHGILLAKDTSTSLTIGAPVHIENPLTVDGFITSTNGGFRFPDGTIQATAAGAASQWVQSGNTISYSKGRVGIGTRSPYTQLTLSESIGFTNSTTPMLYINQTAGTNTRPIIAHSPAYPNWGLEYRDRSDMMVFQASGSPALSIKLFNKQVGIGTDDPKASLDVKGNFYVRDSSDRVVMNCSAGGATLSLGVKGNEGDLIVRDSEGRSTLNVDGGGAAMYVGTSGNPGDIKVRNNSGVNTLSLDGSRGKLTARGIDLSAFFYVDGQRPIRIKRYSVTGGRSVNTGFSTTNWMATIAGFRALGGDIQENDRGNIIEVYTKAASGKWQVYANFRTHNQNETWEVWVMFIRREMAW